MHKIISILGSTGSIGTQTLEVIRAHHSELEIGFLTTNSKIELLARQVQQFKVHGVAIADEAAAKRFKDISDFKGQILVGQTGVCEAAAYDRNSILMSALVGFSGVEPTLAAISKGTTIALANKETLVSAGSVITQAAQKHNAKIIAVDSEHSAILQCLIGEDLNDVERLFITASGGPFRTTPVGELHNVTVEQALRHPNWSMGSKITVDSATLMNKGFEVIEARWLFDIAPENISVLIHPQSIVHSMVQFVDGSVKAQLGLPDMNLPIHYALNYPRRVESAFNRLDLTSIGDLSFSQPDFEKFPCLQLAFSALQRGGTATAIVNGANEVAVAKFLNRSLSFMDIARVVSACLDAIEVVDNPSLSDILAADFESRRLAALVASTTTTSTP